MIRTTLIAAGIALGLTAMGHAQERPVLDIYTYDSFIADWGPGPKIETAFESVCGCDLRFTSAGDGAALLARLQLEGARSPADIVLGFDTALMARAAGTGLFAPHGIDPGALDLPGGWGDELFLPYDWGYFAFVYDKTRLANPPGSFPELAAMPEDFRIIIQDPRSSTPGLGLLLWVETAYGDRAPEIWESLAPRILTVTKGWSEAYGLFLNGEADMVLSYTTSPAYHAIAENDDSKAAAVFAEGHYMQIEIAGMTATSDQPELARDFLRFMLSEPFQSIIPTGNWMYPVRLPKAGLPAAFTPPVAPEAALLLPPDAALRVRDTALETWLAALSR